MNSLLPFVICHTITALTYLAMHRHCRHWSFLARYSLGIVGLLFGCLAGAAMLDNWQAVVLPAVSASAGGWILLAYALEARIPSEAERQADRLRRLRVVEAADQGETLELPERNIHS